MTKKKKGKKSKSKSKSKDTKYCENCGEEVDKEAEICPECGVRVKGSSSGEKNPGIAAVLSALFVGFGQIYNGQIGKGIGFMIIGAISLFMIFILVGIILYPLFWIFNIYDAYDTANKINQGKIKV